MKNGDRSDFPIVGVGASAGGLDAYRQFLRALPNRTGAAYVFIQHLDPNHESMMADLLSRYTSMPVLQAHQAMPVAPNHVYIIPPNKFIKLIDHGIFLDEPVNERGVRMSIDYFFRSMAETLNDKAIGILLSGTGSDGTQGIREIKAAGGVVMVQHPATVEYDGMPRSAVSTGMVDFVLPIAEMAEVLVNFINHPFLEAHSEATTLSESAPSLFKTVLNLLQAHTEHDFRSYKKATLERRIQRRMGLQKINTFEQYVSFLRENPEEITRLSKDLLIGVTRFFRDADAWRTLETNAIAPALQSLSSGDVFRAWVAGCASGEEAYSVAMVIFNQMDVQRKDLDVQIFATDLNEEAISVARSGLYPASIVDDIPSRYMTKFFCSGRR